MSLAVCAIVQNAATRIAEWIAFHQVAGVERFYLYDNESTDRTREVAGRFEGVEVTDRPGKIAQLPAYVDCLEKHPDEEWIAFIDADEFLWSPTGLPLPTLLDQRYPDVAAVAACTLLFGTSGLEEPPELRIDSLVHRAEDGEPAHQHVKAILRPQSKPRPMTPHNFDIPTVDENGVGFAGPHAPNPSWKILRINHYLTGSVPEAVAKSKRRRADIDEITGCLDDYLSGNYDRVYDAEACVYLPLVKARLASV